MIDGRGHTDRGGDQRPMLFPWYSGLTIISLMQQSSPIFPITLAIATIRPPSKTDTRSRVCSIARRVCSGEGPLPHTDSHSRIKFFCG